MDRPPNWLRFEKEEKKFAIGIILISLVIKIVNKNNNNNNWFYIFRRLEINRSISLYV